jgi:hypothetical protein
LVEDRILFWQQKQVILSIFSSRVNVIGYFIFVKIVDFSNDFLDLKENI